MSDELKPTESMKLLARFSEGDEQAATELFDRYVNRLLALARSRLSGAMNRRVEAEDIVQSAYRSFFRHAEADRFQIDAGGQLWGLLAAITINKVRDKAKFHTAQRRTIQAEQSMNASQSCYGLVPSNFADDPTIDEAVELEEQLKLVLEQLSDLQREILELYLQNVDSEEIAKRVRRSPRTVRRALGEVRELLERRLTGNEHS
jgi:RNA polymerase sigma-70 factor (ECF subfamily)